MDADSTSGGGNNEIYCDDSVSYDSEASTHRRRRKYPCLCYVWVICSAFLLLGLVVAIVTLQILYFSAGLWIYTLNFMYFDMLKERGK